MPLFIISLNDTLSEPAQMSDAIDREAYSTLETAKTAASRLAGFYPDRWLNIFGLGGKKRLSRIRHLSRADAPNMILQAIRKARRRALVTEEEMDW